MTDQKQAGEIVDGAGAGGVAALATGQASAAWADGLDRAGVAAIFVARDLTIESFTQAAGDLLGLGASDRSQPLAAALAALEFDPAAAISGAGEAGAPEEHEVRRHDKTAAYLVRIRPADAEGVGGTVLIFTDVTRLAAAAVKERARASELNHRMLNLMTMVSSLAHLTASGVSSTESFAGRVDTMSGLCGVLGRDDWAGSLLDAVVLKVAEPWVRGRSERVTFSGPRILLKPRTALAVGRILHELVANAAQHGALSRGGKASLVWRLTDTEPKTLTVDWVEDGGPPLDAAPAPKFGMEMIDRGVTYELSGQAQCVGTPNGLAWHFEIPLDNTLMAVTDAAW